ncbi:iron ABC transporter permease [Rhodococcus sp. T2V]|uniref:FecCD family ABC transporter permease n=1 Tax=Rhodococcus sp. T2V TaxID=3034164 RepID=UPI0023E0C52D|nr:iron ABC transporter permease [Rhodococcus sp. T2V]MDF3312210.1 iron ABC transporter permease [Rhodococcus sp. T2V]
MTAVSENRSNTAAPTNNASRARRRHPAVLVTMIVLLAAGALLSATLGHYPLSAGEIVSVLRDPNDPATADVAQIFYQVRLVRIWAAIMVGAALALAGAAFQAVFRNPMVSPDVLGASGGAGLGAALGLLFALGTTTTQTLSFVFGLAAVAVVFVVDRAVDPRGGSILTLILTGMVVAALCSALISLVKYVGDPENKLPQITFWLLGGLSAVRSVDLIVLGGALLVAGIPLTVLRWRLNALSFGDDQAQALGINVAVVRGTTIAAATLLTAAAVSVAGVVGWVGLIIPHLARILVGPDNRYAMPAATLLGALFLLAVDDVARSASSIEIPLGVLTALLGAPVFLYLLAAGRRRGWL